MQSNKQERTFSNAPLRDQWEKRAQNIAAQCKQEAEWKEKSVKLLFSKWTYHLVISHGDKLSDLQKLTNSTNEEETKPKIKFKIVPPPPRIKHEPAPPPPSPRKKASSGPRRPKRKVEVDMFKLYWRESWMSLKPPKYLYLKSKELKARIPGFTTIVLTNNRRYKQSQAELMCPHEKWTHSWKQVKSSAQLERSKEKQFKWEMLFESNLPCKLEIEEYFLPVWARTWKFMNFAFRQQKQNWDCIWLDYQQILSNKFDKVQQLEEQEEASDWEDSWQLSESQKTTNTAVMLTLNDVFQPGWTNSWLLTVAPLQEDEEYQKNWSSSWGFRQQIRWCKVSQQSQYRHSNKLMRRRKTLNLLLTSQLDDKITNSTEWTEMWRTPKGSGRLEEDEPEDEEEMDVEEKMDTEGEEEDDGVDHEEDVNVDDKEVRDEGVDEMEEDDLEMEEEDIGKNEQYKQVHKECPKEIYKKEDKEIYNKNEKFIIRMKVVDNNGEEEDEGVDEEEEEDEDINKENNKEVQEEDKISNEKDEESEVDKEEEEEDADSEGEDSDSDEEEEIDEKTDKEQEEEHKVDKAVKNEITEKDEDKDNVEEEETKIDEDEDKDEKEDEVEKDQDREEEAEVEEEDEEVNEKVKVHKKDDKTKEQEKEETDEEETDDEEASAEENGSHEEIDKKEEDSIVEKEEEKKKLRKGVKRKPDVPLHLQFHKLNMSSSWNQSWMVAIAHQGGDGNEEEEDEAEEKEEWFAWKESWRICLWRKLDKDEVVCFSTEHRTQRYLGLMHEDDGMPRSKWTLSWKMTNAAAEEEDTEEEDEEEEEEKET